MVNLIFSILFSAYLVICLKSFKHFKVNTFQAIVFNYIACVIAGSIYEWKVPDYAHYIREDWFYYAAYLGATFFILFNVMGYITRNVGATVTSVAGKLSMVIPVAAAFYFYNEPITAIKIIGVVLALAAVILSSLKREKPVKTSAVSLTVPAEDSAVVISQSPLQETLRGTLSGSVSNRAEQPKTVTSSGFSLKYVFWTLFLFVGSGINDTLMKYSQFNFLDELEFAPFNIMVFSAAAAAGIVALVYQLARGEKLQMRSIPAGIVLGVPNFFSLQFLLGALNTKGWDSSVVFPVNNIGVVAVTGIAAYLIFKEKLSPLNIAGIVLAFVAITIMFL